MQTPVAIATNQMAMCCFAPDHVAIDGTRRTIKSTVSMTAKGMKNIKSRVIGSGVPKTSDTPMAVTTAAITARFMAELIISTSILTPPFL
jgi:hypothetical protein